MVSEITRPPAAKVPPVTGPPPAAHSGFIIPNEELPQSAATQRATKKIVGSLIAQTDTRSLVGGTSTGAGNGNANGPTPETLMGSETPSSVSCSSWMYTCASPLATT